MSMTNALGPPVMSLSGTNILSASYTALADAQSRTTFQIGRTIRTRFHVAVILATGSPITGVNFKVQHRYNNFSVDPNLASVIGGWEDLQQIFQTLDGTPVFPGQLTSLAAPIASPGTFKSFYIDDCRALLDCQLMVQSVGGNGIAGDVVNVYTVT